MGTEEIAAAEASITPDVVAKLQPGDEVVDARTQLRGVILAVGENALKVAWADSTATVIDVARVDSLEIVDSEVPSLRDEVEKLGGVVSAAGPGIKQIFVESPHHTRWASVGLHCLVVENTPQGVELARTWISAGTEPCPEDGHDCVEFECLEFKL